MNEITVRLNGKEVKARKGETILDVATREGIKIPTLCHDKRLENFGACRVCLVKVEGAKSYVPSCSTEVVDGMVIDTEAEEVKEARRISISLLLSEHFGDCVSPCSLRCPANIDIQGYIALIRARKYREAIKLIKEKIPMPLTIGRVCPHPCETVCRRNRVEEPVAINNLKRFVADYDLAQKHPYTPEKEPPKNKKIAIIGAGPAGLSAAYYLAVKGYNVKIFEKNRYPGGMLYYGIPEYRLPKSILFKEIDMIRSLGVEIQCEVEFGIDITLESLKKEGYEAVFIGIGTQKSMSMRIEGENLDGVLGGIDFLYQIASKNPPNMKGKKVIVVGGGNTAMDAARTSLRLGAREVEILYRRTRAEMPANEYEIEEAIEEGIKFTFLSAPVKIEKNGKGLTVECIRMQLGEPDASGRRRPVPIQGSNYKINTDYLIAAIGQRVDTEPIKNLDILSERDRVNADPVTGATKLLPVFAGGDCVTGPATVVEALAAGRKAADGIDHYLRTGKIENHKLEEFNSSRGDLEDIPDEVFEVYEKKKRVKVKTLEPDKRRKNFDEIEKTIDEKSALEEASRCLECGCIEGFSCKLRDISTEYGASDEFRGEKNIYTHYLKIQEDRPPILRDENKCIKCGICVRTCDEIWGIGVYSFIQRGFDTRIVPALDTELHESECDFCGQCADACPTGALSINPEMPKPGPFKVEKIKTNCLFCPLHCELYLNIYANRVIRVTALPPEGENEGCLCVRGRFGYNLIFGKTYPIYEHSNNGKKELDISEAIEKTTQLLQNAANPLILTSTNLSSEEYDGIYKLSGALNNCDVFHVSHDLFARNSCTHPVFGKSSRLRENLEGIQALKLSEITNHNSIVVFGIYPGRDYPVMEMKIRNAVKKGANLFIINNDSLRIEPYAKLSLRLQKKDYSLFWELLADLLHSFQEDKYKIEHYKEILGKIVKIAKVKPALIIKFIEAISRGRTCFITAEDEINWSSMKAFTDTVTMLKEKSSILILAKGANPNGALDFMKEHPVYETLEEIPLNEHDTIMLFNLPIELKKYSGNLIDISPFPLNRNSSYHIFIPYTSLYQTGGKYLKYDKNATKISKTMENEYPFDNLRVINEISRKLSDR